MLKPRSRAFQMALVASSALLLVLILPLIGNIHDIEFQSRRGVEFSAAASGVGGTAESRGWLIFTMVLRVMFVLAAAVFIFQIIVNKSFRRLYLVLMLIFFGALTASKILGWDTREVPETVPAAEGTLWEHPPEEDLGIQPVEREVEPSNVQTILLAIALSSIVVVAGGVALTKWLKARPEATDDGYEEILGSITDAAHRLRAGEDPRTVVLFCYQEMIRILSIKGKIDASCLTPREFEVRLHDLGMSGESISQLTVIFEIVRYSGRVDDTFAARALTCLEAIQEAHTIDEQ